MAYTFVISDESINSYGYRVLTSGIDLTNFKNNPVMFYMHDRNNGVIGRWENFRIKEQTLYADAVFDESDAMGMIVKDKIEKGFLHSASISLAEPIVFENIDGVDTVISCGLREVSIVDIPSNKNAVKLCDKNGKYVYTLSELTPMTEGEFIQEFMRLLGLDEKATGYDILQALRELINKKETPAKEINHALELGYITHNECALLMQVKDTNPVYISNFLKEKETENIELISKEVDKANIKGKIIRYDKELYLNIGKQIGLKNLRQLFNVMPTQLKITDWIEGGKDANRANWGLNEYRKYAPNELKENPQLYNELVEKETGKDSPSLGLDYYRKHNPQYLMDNPDEYKRMLAEQNKSK
jgi:hypothetical protein